MAKKKKAPVQEIATVNEKAVIEVEEKVKETLVEEIELAVAEEAVVDPVEEMNEVVEEELSKEEIQEESVEDKKEVEPEVKKPKKQGVVVEVSLAGVTVMDVNGCRFKLFGVKGNIGDTIEF